MAVLNPDFVSWSQLCELRGAEREPPAVFPGLWVRGSLEGLRGPTVAVVGTRAASVAGKGLAETVSRTLGAHGVCILSGLALGIDAAAHKGALAAGSPTIGILGGGHARFFPNRNRELGDRMIAGGGAVCSPYPPEDDAWPSRFLERNSAVAALADAVVVVEAPARSGALNTAGWAAGRIPVLVFPGDVDRSGVAGCLALIRDGATLVRSATDILAELRIAQHLAAPSRNKPVALTALHAAIFEALSLQAQSADQLIETTGVKAADVFAVLTELEIAGAVTRREGGVFARSLIP